MSFGMEQLFGHLGTTLDVISHQQQVVTNNVANVNTPGYHAKVADFAAVLEQRTNPFETKLAVRLGSALPMEALYPENGKVNLQHEFTQMHKNSLFYQMATRRLSSVINNIRTASQIGR
ncbi:MAG: flagellar basal body protein [Candidatus Melainabacteria bacterium]|nr:flagellar basal body protein [Candidatus Melainabacteria bacterium]